MGLLRELHRVATWRRRARQIVSIVFVCFSPIVAVSAQAQTAAAVEAPISQSSVVFSPAMKHLSFYGQNSIDGRTGNIVTQNRIKSPVLGIEPNGGASDGSLSLYVGAHIEDDTLSRNDLVYNDNFIAPIAGLSLIVPRLGAGAYAEAQYQMRKREDLHPDDARTLQGRFALYHSAHRMSRSGRHVNAFVETYGELVHRTELGRNLFFSHVSRGGPRIHGGGRWSLDFFPELTVKLDREGLPWENQLDLRLGTRINFEAGLWRASAHVTGATGVFAGNRRYQAPIKGLLAVGVEI